MKRCTPWTAKKQTEILARVAEGWSLTDAARSAGVARQSLYNHRHQDAVFAEALVAAVEAGTDVLEDEARRRAVDGVRHETPIYYQGDHVGSVIETKYSDTL